ncbi:iron-siderophore ABC transporter substrate-binding protein [Gloeocapsopsis dulcis]|nr:iron-siderophore ABC transporter substrate-binding protein [Gloeocapsopsis dulcis]WNN90197.1 iron-siderophore ABC transporter substrate-binding protein [Gloeocapsopsis dulcis]
MKRTINRFIGWLLLGITGFLLITACTHLGRQSMSVSSKSSIVECHNVQHIMGETCVPTEPKRVVTLSAPTLNNALALGVKPVGSTYFYQSEFIRSPQSKEIKFLGRSQPDLEQMLLLKPDLILGWEVTGREIYSLLSKIAPTALGKWEGPLSWQEHFNFVAEVLGKTEVAQAAWKQYYHKIEKLKEAFGDRFQSKKISFIHLGFRGIESDTNNSFAGSILKDAGLQRPDAQNITAPGGILSISEEELDKADGDVLFVATWTDNDQEFLAKLKQKPLWQRLQAVQQNRVYIVSFPNWTGGSLLAANAVIDDLFKYLVNSP